MSDSRAPALEGSLSQANSRQTSPAMALMVLLAVAGSLATSSPEPEPTVTHTVDHELEPPPLTLLSREKATYSIDIVVDEPEHVRATNLILSIDGMVETEGDDQVPNVTGWVETGRGQQFLRFEAAAELETILSSSLLEIPDCIHSADSFRREVLGACSLSLRLEVSNWSEFTTTLFWNAVVQTRWRDGESSEATNPEPFRVTVELSSTSAIPGGG